MPYSSGRSLPATLGGDGCSAAPPRPPYAPVYDPLAPYAPVYDPLVVLSTPSALCPATLDAESFARPISTMPAIVASAPACPAKPSCVSPRGARAPAAPHESCILCAAHFARICHTMPARPRFATDPNCHKHTPFLTG